ncbi:MAG: CgeB family protein [Gammaproteobacteria bacterium]
MSHGTHSRPTGMQILYAATLSGTAAHRAHALTDLGHHVTAFDFTAYYDNGGRISRWITWRSLRGATIGRLNNDLLRMARNGRFDLAWFDKAQWVRPETIDQLHALGIACVHYSSDLPSGIRGEPGWRLFRAAANRYDAVVIPSAGHIPEYEALGVRRHLLMPFGYAPHIHFPPPPQWSDANRPYDVTFIGTPYEDRPRFLLDLARNHGVKVKLFGDRWERSLSASELRRLNHETGRYESEYRQAIWQSKICLGFVTHAMAHTNARRWTEIAACGGFLLAEHTPHAHQWFDAGREAAFFTDIGECADQITHYLNSPGEREAIARAGRSRVATSLSNTELMDRTLCRFLEGS